MPKPKPEIIPAEEVNRILAEAIEENLQVLRALAESDRNESPWKQGTYDLDQHLISNITSGTRNDAPSTAASMMRKEELESKIASLQKEKGFLAAEVESLRRRRTLLDLQNKADSLEKTIGKLRNQKEELEGQSSSIESNDS